jgi:hypothetical protein
MATGLAAKRGSDTCNSDLEGSLLVPKQSRPSADVCIEESA